MIQGWVGNYETKLLCDESCGWVCPECFLKMHILKQAMTNETLLHKVLLKVFNWC